MVLMQSLTRQLGLAAKLMLLNNFVDIIPQVVGPVSLGDWAITVRAMVKT